MNDATEFSKLWHRITLAMVALGILGAVVVSAFGYPSAGAGFAIGAAVSILNFAWLHHAVDGLVNAEDLRVPRGVVIKFCIRYPLALAIAFVFYKTGWLPFQAVLAGFLVLLGGLFTEVGYQIWKEMSANEPVQQP